MLSSTLKKSLLIMLVCIPSLHASEVTEATHPVTPFTAQYSMDWNGGISLSGTTTRQLKSAENNHWTFQSSASAMFASIKESTVFTWQTDTLTPLHYSFKRSVLGKKRLVDVSFDWAKQQATNDVENKPWQMPIKSGVQDKLSYQLLLQHDVSKGKTEFEYDVADGGHIKHYAFRVDGKERIKAPIGEYDAIRVIRVREKDNPRQTYIWFAPELNYQIIKLEQIEKKDKSYTLLLKSLKGES